MKTSLVKAEDAKKRWFVVDASGQVLGRLAAEIAMLLRGKRRADFTPQSDMGDCVIVVNVAKIRLTGDKLEQKYLKRYSGYPGGLKKIPYEKLMVSRPEVVLRHAVWGMLPHTRMGRCQIRSLKLYRGADHPHVAQNPSQLVIKKGNLVKA